MAPSTPPRAASGAKVASASPAIALVSIQLAALYECRFQSRACHGAIVDACRARGYAAGYGPIGQPDADAKEILVACLGGDIWGFAAAPFPGGPATCLDFKPHAEECRLVSHLSCRSEGYAAGFGPFRLPDAASVGVGPQTHEGVICLDAASVRLRSLSQEEATRLDVGCVQGSSSTNPFCLAAAHAFCRTGGSASGFALPWLGSNLPVVCLGELSASIDAGLAPASTNTVDTAPVTPSRVIDAAVVDSARDAGTPADIHASWPSDAGPSSDGGSPPDVTGLQDGSPLLEAGPVQGVDSAPVPMPDNDRDGIPDSYEDELLRKYAPRIWLHSNENRWPVNVNWLLARSTLRFSHERCNDHQILPFGAVTASNLSGQSHRSARDPISSWPWEACDHYGSSHRSNGYAGALKDTFFLQFRDATHNGISPSQRQDWQIYGHVYRVADGAIAIQYWQLYTFNDSFASANHEGDWEYTSVIVNKNGVPQQVVFFRHDRDEVYNVNEVEWVRNHHVTYSAKGSHGQYRGMTNDGMMECLGDRLRDRAQGFADNCNRGVNWDTWDMESSPIVNVGEKYYPLNGADWIRYSGLWGEIGGAADVVKWTSGPRGPAYKSVWNWRP